jgi:MFS superfamily sulfate permease-like transporter
MNNSKPLWKQDIFAAISLLLISIPLSAGIAVASKADPTAGIITAIFGALFFGFFSSSPLVVYGPAAGIGIFVSMAVLKLADFTDVSKAVFLAGIWLGILSLFNVYKVVNLVPRTVTKGMVSGIGLILILKMIPHLFGYDGVSIGFDEFTQSDGRNTITELYYGIQHYLPGAVIIGFASLVTMFAMRKKPYAAFAAVVVGVVINLIFQSAAPDFLLSGNHMLEIASPKIDFTSLGDMNGDWFYIVELSLILTTVIIFEGLVTLDIFQKVDPNHQPINFKKEMRLLGVGNVLMGLLGALPIMPVLVRSTANVRFGAKSRWANIVHGLLLILVFTCHGFFKFIPMASIGAVLVYVGVNLLNPRYFKEMFAKGADHWVPFLATVIVMLFTNLLWGLAVGFVIGLSFSMRSITKRSMVLVQDDERYLLKFHKDVTFLHKAELRELLESVPVEKEVLIDGTGNITIDREIEDWIEEYVHDCRERNCKITFIKSRLAISKLFKLEPA